MWVRDSMGNIVLDGDNTLCLRIESVADRNEPAYRLLAYQDQRDYDILGKYTSLKEAKKDFNRFLRLLGN